MMWEMILIYIMGAAAFIYMIWFLFFPRKGRKTGAPAVRDRTPVKRRIGTVKEISALTGK